MNNDRERLDSLVPTVDIAAGLSALQDGMRRVERRRGLVRPAAAVTCALALTSGVRAVANRSHTQRVSTAPPAGLYPRDVPFRSLGTVSRFVDDFMGGFPPGEVVDVFAVSDTASLATFRSTLRSGETVPAVDFRTEVIVVVPGEHCLQLTNLTVTSESEGHATTDNTPAGCRTSFVPQFYLVAVRRTDLPSGVLDRWVAGLPTPAPQTETDGPTTTTPVTPETIFVPTVGVRCPAPAFLNVKTDQQTQDEMAKEQDDLRADLQLAQPILSGSNAGFDPRYSFDLPLRIVVYLSRAFGPTDELRGRLVKTLAHSDRLEFIEVDYTKADVRAASAKIAAEAKANPDAFNEFSEPMGPERGDVATTVGLNPGQDALASSLVERFGPAVQIELGGRPYVPVGCGPQPPPPVCPDVLGGDPAAVKLDLSVELIKPSMRVTELGRATLTVRNNGSTVFDASSGPELIGALVTPGTHHVVGAFTGATQSVLVFHQVQPGQSATIPVIFGTARCDGGEGSAIPPGVYGLVVVVGASGREAGRGYVSPEVVVTITQ